VNIGTILISLATRSQPSLGSKCEDVKGFDGRSVTHMLIHKGCSMLLGNGNLTHQVRTGIRLVGEARCYQGLTLACHCKGEACA